jgi:hypothetical protein
MLAIGSVMYSTMEDGILGFILGLVTVGVA